MTRSEGFAAVPTWMIRDTEVSVYALNVYAALASRAGLYEIHPSQAALAREARCSDRQVRRALVELEELGVVERVRRTSTRGRATNAYTLHPNGRRKVPDSQSATSEVPDSQSGGSGLSEQTTPLIEVDNPEVERARETRTPHLIPEPFIVTADMRRWAAQEVSGVDVDASTRVFVDYWRAESGPKAKKRDWVAAWRNWLRKDAPSRAPQTFAQQKQNNTLDLIGRMRQEEQHAALGDGGAAGVHQLV